MQKYTPPLTPPRGEVNAADAFDIGSFDEEDTKGYKVYIHFSITISFKTIGMPSNLCPSRPEKGSSSILKQSLKILKKEL